MLRRVSVPAVSSNSATSQAAATVTTTSVMAALQQYQKCCFSSFSSLHYLQKQASSVRNPVHQQSVRKTSRMLARFTTSFQQTHNQQRKFYCSALSSSTSSSSSISNSSTGYSTSSPSQFVTRRFNSTAANNNNEQKQKQQAGEQNNKEGNKTTEEGGADGKKPEGGGETEGGDKSKSGGGFRSHFEGIRTDIKQFPDIYNGPNMLSLLLFTVFCLSSTGTQVEATWWLDHWAVDADSHKRPWNIFLHSVHTNNFLSMVFAIILLHNSLHPLTHGLAGGSAALMQYCAIVSFLSGIVMAAANNVYFAGGEAKDILGRPYRGEKQYGPWDIAGAVLVMQYLRLGIPPHRLLLSFNGWVKYACLVGAVCILIYDPQPVVCGTVIGYALCRLSPVFRGVGAAV